MTRRETVAVTRTHAPVRPGNGKPAFVLVHGSWHGAWCFARLIPHLTMAGHVVVAKDLPGHALDARFPDSFAARPFDAMRFATEPSRLAGVKLDDYVQSVVTTIDELVAAGSGPVVLLGHSMGGLPITAVGEAVPDKIRKLVYLAAYLPASKCPATSYARIPESEGSKVGPALRANPGEIGALRLDPRSADEAYAAGLKAAFAADISDDEWQAMRHFLTPDEPASPFATPIDTTVARWGSIPRAYIRCTQDQAIPLRLQQKFIDDADAFAPHNTTDVVTLTTSHSPFLSRPADLAAALLALAS